MTKLNHNRPNLMSLDNLRRESRHRIALPMEDGMVAEAPDRKPWPWENIVPPPRPNEDLKLAQSQIISLDLLLDSHLKFVIATGIASPIFGKPSAKKRKRLEDAQAQLIDQSVTFLGFCAEESSRGSLSTWHWLQSYCNAHRKNGNRLFDSLVTFVLEDGLERYFWGTLKGDSQKEKDNLTSFVERVCQ